MENMLLCPHCGYECNHLLTTLVFEDDDYGNATSATINSEHKISIKEKYRFRSQGNIHLLFSCESGHFYFKSFDGHKGNVFIDGNELTEQLADYLNKNSNPDRLTLGFDYTLLGKIEKFFERNK